MTLREAKVVGHIVSGKDMGLSLRLAGFPTSVSLVPGRFITDEMKAEIERQQALLVKTALDKGLINAEELHEYLTDAIRANMADIRSDDGSFKPLSEWPVIWQQMAEAGDVEIEYASERSHDGETRDQAGGWDITGKILKVKYRFPRKAEFVKLAMQHKAINALVNPNDKLGEGLSDLAGSIDRAIAEGRERAAKRNRVIDVTPEKKP